MESSSPGSIPLFARHPASWRCCSVLPCTLRRSLLLHLSQHCCPHAASCTPLCQRSTVFNSQVQLFLRSLREPGIGSLLGPFQASSAALTFLSSIARTEQDATAFLALKRAHSLITSTLDSRILPETIIPIPRLSLPRMTTP